MAKYANTLIMDAALTFLGTASNRIIIGTAQPTNYAESNTYAVGTLADTSGNWSLAAGDTSGRKTTHTAATIAVGTSGTINHVYFSTTTGSGTLLFVGTCAPTSVTAGGTVILAAWDVDEILNPS